MSIWKALEVLYRLDVSSASLEHFLQIFLVKNGVRKPAASAASVIYNRGPNLEQNAIRQPLESSLRALSISTNLMQQK